MVDASLRVDLRFVGSGAIRELGALEDVEVVIGGMATGVAFGANRGACMCLVTISVQVEEVSTNQK